jgi:hypothetical protein
LNVVEGEAIIEGFGLAALAEGQRQGSLAKLPAEDRAAFTRLGGDVAALLKKSEQKRK